LIWLVASAVWLGLVLLFFWMGIRALYKMGTENLDLLRKSGEFPVSNEELDETATTVYKGI
jgi:hypothetical protein